MRKPKTARAIGALLLAIACCAAAPRASAVDRPGADGFLLALPGYEFEFPRDHGSHDGYRTEWWYYTGHLVATSGRRYGFEVTFFRVGVTPPQVAGENAWDLRNLSLAHFAITDVEGKAFRYYEKLNRSTVYTAQAKSGFLDVFNEGWRATTAGDGSWRLVAAAGTDRIELDLKTRKPPAIHGENGVSVKAQVEGYASHYYSMTRLEVDGTVNGQRCRGEAWMDHEFGSSALRENQQGWDWYSVQLDNETELMLYVIRRADGTPDVTSSGSLITAENQVVPIKRDDMRITARDHWKSKRSGARYPMGWLVEIPRFGIRLSLDPELQDQELVTRGSTQVTYWEGAVGVQGTFGGVPVRGNGYVEMTGYDRAFRAP